MGVMKVQPWGKDQGDYVLIDSENFDPKIHKKFEAKKTKKKGTKNVK